MRKTVTVLMMAATLAATVPAHAQGQSKRYRSTRLASVTPTNWHVSKVVKW